MTFKDFLADERASVSTEAIVAVPFLIWLFGSSFVWWDGYRTAMTAQKSTFTISDLMSRELGEIDQDYLNGMNQMFAFLTSETGATSLRVTIVRNVLAANGVDEELELRWSNVAGDEYLPHTDLEAIEARIPVLGLGDEVIVVEGHLVWDPLVSTGILPTDAHTLVATSPRYVPQVLWDNG